MRARLLAALIALSPALALAEPAAVLAPAALGTAAAANTGAGAGNVPTNGAALSASTGLCTNASSLPVSCPALARTVAVAGNPGSTTSTTLVMAGFGKTLTPARTGAVWVYFAAYCYNTTAAAQVHLQLAYGVGTAPVNGAAATGTAFGPLLYSQSTTANAAQNCSVGYEVSGLTVGTTYWFDVQFEAAIGGAANIGGSAMTLQEEPF